MGRKSAGKAPSQENIQHLLTESVLKEIQPVSNKAVILLCEKCGRKAGESGENVAKDLQKELKHAANERFGKKNVRTQMSSCFDICPKGRIVACVIPTDRTICEPAGARFIEFDAKDAEAAKTALLDLVSAT